MKILPSKYDWSRWTLPSKYSAISLLIGVIGIVFAGVTLYRDHLYEANQRRALIEGHKEKFQVMVGMELNHINQFLAEYESFDGSQLAEVKKSGWSSGCKFIDFDELEAAFKEAEKRKSELSRANGSIASIDIDSVEAHEMHKIVSVLLNKLKTPMPAAKKYIELNSELGSCNRVIESHSLG